MKQIHFIPDFFLCALAGGQLGFEVRQRTKYVKQDTAFAEKWRV